MRSNCFPVDTCCFHLYTEHSESTAQGRDIGVCVVEYISCEYVSDFDTCFSLFAEPSSVFALPPLSLLPQAPSDNAIIPHNTTAKIFLRAIVTGNFVDISFFITYSVIGNRKTRYVLPESFKTRRFGHDSACTLNNNRRNSI